MRKRLYNQPLSAWRLDVTLDYSVSVLLSIFHIHIANLKFVYLYQNK